MKYHIFLLFAPVFFSLHVFAQAPTDGEVSGGIHAMARYHQGRVELRWAPADFATWQRGNQQGYIVERYEEEGLKSLTPLPLRPLSLEQWATKTDTSNVWNKAAAQLLYGKMNGLPQKPTLAQIKEVSQIQAYQLANALIAADLSSETAAGMALSFSDPDVKPGITYGYRIRIAGTAVGNPDTARAFVNTKTAWEAPPLMGLSAENEEHAVLLKWPKKLSKAFFTAYWVEKSEDGGKNFKRLHQSPLFVSGFAEDGADNFYTDSLQQNYRPAHYRVTGITPWGDLGKPSETVKGMGRDLTPPGGAEKVQAVSHAANKVTITWDAVVNPADLAGWYVRRSNDAAGIFTNINEKPLPPSARRFDDTEPFAFQQNYYRVVAVDTAGNEGVSMNAYCFIVDSIPPAQPKNLVGAIDSTGFVALSWEMGAEPDLRGYRVYASHGPDREFTQLTSEPVFQNFFADTITLRTLNEKIYYRVAAVDYRWNHSEYSALLELKKPDIVPPLAPAFSHYRVDRDSVSLRWTNSTSKDVMTQILWKKEANGDWKKAATFQKPFANSFTDRNLSPNLMATYALEAIDDDGLSSGKSSPIAITASAQRPRVQNLQAQLNEETAAAQLTWQYPTQDCRFVVLRAQADGALLPLKSVSGSEPACTDILREPNKYRYAVKAIFSDGSESEPSDVVEIDR